MNNLLNLKKGMQHGIPIALGYFAVAFTFGMMAVSQGLKVWEAVLISALNVTSAGQFAGLEIIVAQGTYFEMALTQLIINLRYSLMSFSMSQKLDRKESWWHRYIVAFGMTDEIFGISINQPGKTSVFYNYGAMCVAIPGWVLGTATGAVSGKLLPDFAVSALSIAIYGMFLAIIIPPAKKNRVIMLVVLAAMLLSTVCSVLPVIKNLSSGFTIIIITVIVSAVAAYLAPVEKNEENNS